MTRITFFLPLPAAELLLFNSALFLFHSGYLSLPVLPALCLQPLMCSLEKWLMGLHGVQCVSTGPECAYAVVCVYICLCERVRVPQCEHCNVTGLCNWNGNEPISSCSGVPPFAAFTSPFQLRQTHSFSLTLCSESVLAVTCPSIVTHGSGEVVIKMSSLRLTDTRAHAPCPVDFPGFVLWPSAYWASCGITKTCNYHHLTISLPSKFAP